MVDFISFAKLAISNPDLPERFKNNWEIAPVDFKTLFTPGPEGYITYLTYEEAQKQSKKT